MYRFLRFDVFQHFSRFKHTLPRTYSRMQTGKTKRVIQFSAGPAKLPDWVLKKAQEELLNYNDLGISVMEMSHRSPDFQAILESAKNRLINLMNIPPNYRVLFLQGGGSGLFAAIPMNLMKTGKADYLVTGGWSAKAVKEAEKYGTVHLVLPKLDQYTNPEEGVLDPPLIRGRNLVYNKGLQEKRNVKDIIKEMGIPPQDEWSMSEDADYVYYCANETVFGVEFPFLPEVKKDIPLVCDMSSNFLSRPVDVSKYGLIYAGAQKNVGIAGVAVVIVREDLLGNPSKYCPSIWDFTLQVKNNSLYNTPSSYSIYILGLVLEWLETNGGVDTRDRINREKSSCIYQIIDESDGFYSCPVENSVRSRMNLPFRIGGPSGNTELEKKFLEETAAQGMITLKGHRSVGGIRASLYNAMTLEETKVLAAFMRDFRARNSGTSQ